MAEIIGGIGTSHVPSIAGAIAANRQDEPNWKPFFDSYKPVHDWLAQRRPDVIVVVYNDHGLNFFLDTIPTFAVGAAANYAGEDEGWGIPPAPSFDGFPELSWHLIESAVDDGFDITMCQNLVVDHGFSVPMSLFYPPPMDVPVKVVPVCVNTVQHPLPRPDRALALGRSLGRAIESYPGDEKVVIAGTGGLSHQLDGERAGFINREFDLRCLDAIVDDPYWIARHSIHELVEKAGTQGVEIIMWLLMRGALDDQVTELHRNYHISISNTAAGLLLIDNAA